jgi:dihydroxyacetone kinase
MTRILDNPADFAAQALAGFCALHPERLRPVPGGVVRADPRPRGKVALVVGGGSGHYPAFAGYVGPGLADAAVAGDVFASPPASRVASVARHAQCGGGVVLAFGNYAGDVLHFGLAAQQLRDHGIDTRILRVSDDVASAGADHPELRRGIAGDLLVFKIAGAAAEAGMPLDEVERLGRLANARTRSFGVAFDGCTLPGAQAPLFTVAPGCMAVGLGIHGEPGISEQPVLPAASLAAMLVERLVREAPSSASGRVAVALNGLGRSKWEELFVLWTSVRAELEKSGLTPVLPEVGEFVTSLDMAGCSLSLTWLDDELEPLWKAACDTPVLRRGSLAAADVADAAVDTEIETVSRLATGSPASQGTARCVAGLLDTLAAALRAAEPELGALDAQAGDGDHGQGMARGSTAAAEAAALAAQSGAGAGGTLAAAGDAWAERAGGTSGALWGVALRGWACALGDQQAASPASVARGARLALEAVTGLGGAKPGDKTLVDAMLPFVVTLETEVAKGAPLPAAWTAAAQAAAAAADATTALTPRLGRARPLAARSIGHRDAGAVSLALGARVVGEALARGEAK